MRLEKIVQKTFSGIKEIAKKGVRSLKYVGLSAATAGLVLGGGMRSANAQEGWTDNLSEGLRSYHNFEDLDDLIDPAFNLIDNSGGRITVGQTPGLIGNCGDASNALLIEDCLEFVTDYWIVSNSGTTPMTISFWANQKQENPNPYHQSETIGRGSAFDSGLGYAQMISFRLYSGNNNFIWYWGQGSTGCVTWGQTDAGTLTHDTWYHILMEISNNSFKIWKNNESIHSQTGLTTGGVYWNGTSYLFAGGSTDHNGKPAIFLQLDEFAVWDRGLTDEERTVLYNNGNGLEHFPLFDTNAPEYYVSVDGSDSFGKGTQEQPWRTIQNAINRIEGSVENPRIIHVAPGVYNSSEPIVMEEYESLQGGGREISIIESSAREIISCANNTFLVGLTIKTTEDLGDVIGVSCRDVSPFIAGNRIDGNHNQLSLGLLVSGEGSNNAQIYKNEIMRHGIGVFLKYSTPCMTDNLILNSRNGFLFANPDISLFDLERIYLEQNNLKNIVNQKGANLEREE